MANIRELKKIAKARLKTVDTLIAGKDWEGAAYMMGYALEITLKTSVCKTLRLVTYPDRGQNDEVMRFFKTHRFDPLLIVSGMEDTFSTRGPVVAWQNWSQFTQEYPGEWTSMRYDPTRVWDEQKIRKLYTNLTGKPHGIITYIKRRW